MKVPFVDLEIIHSRLEKTFIAEFKQILRSSHFTAGQKTEEFEKRWADFCGVKYSTLVNNGTSAIFLALKALNIEKGSEVILPVNTFIATAEAVVLAGLKPVFVDINPTDFLIDIKQIERAITKKTRVILPVHLYGKLVDISLIKKIVDKSKDKIFIVEDACQAHGALWEGKLSLVGDLGCYSFYPSKNLGALGEAGAVVTNNQDWDDYIKLFRNHGSERKYYHSIVGFNFRTSELQAVFLGTKLDSLSKQLHFRVELAKLYHNELSPIPQIILSPILEDFSHVYHLFVIKTPKRDLLQDFLSEKEIGTGIHYPVPLHLQKAFAYLGHKKGDFPVAEQTAGEILSLPFYPGMSGQQLHFVVKNISTFFKKEIR